MLPKCVAYIHNNGRIKCGSGSDNLVLNDDQHETLVLYCVVNYDDVHHSWIKAFVNVFLYIKMIISGVVKKQC